MGRFRVRRVRLNAIGLENGEDFRLGKIEAKGFHSNFELMVVDAIILVEIEKAKLKPDSQSMTCNKVGATRVRVQVQGRDGAYSFLDFRSLLFCQLILFFALDPLLLKPFTLSFKTLIVTLVLGG